MSPVFSQEFAPDTQSQTSALLPMQSETGVFETGRRVRTSFTVLSLALSLGTAGSFVSSAEAADSLQLAALPSVSGQANTLPSFGSARPDTAPASYHTVADGETIWAIAEQHGLTVNDIRRANGIADDQVIQVGQVLKVPTIATNASVLLEAAEFSVSEEDAGVVSSVRSQEHPELRMAALPEAAFSEPISNTAGDESPHLVPGVAPANELQLEAKPVGEATGIEVPAAHEIESELGAATPSLPVAKTELLGNKTPLALLPESEPQAESVQQFADQLSAANETFESPKPIAREVESRLQVSHAEGVTHRVGAGETVWSIARSYGLDPDFLQQSNRITNSRMLMPGDELVIPVEDSLAVSEVERLRHQLMTDQQMAAVSPLVEAPSSQADSSEQRLRHVPAVETIVPDAAYEDVRQRAIEVATADADPFVENLLSQVTATPASQVDEANVVAEEVSDVSEELLVATREQEVLAAALDSGESVNEVALNPQFVDNAEVELTGGEPDSDSSNLLAAAPLGSEVYSPIVENPTGRVVTPEMPVLPAQDVYLPEAPNHFDGYMWPSQGVLTSGYGWRWGRMHRGVDIAGPVGTPIYAAAPGVVVTSGWNSGGYGNLVDIRHPDGSMTRYAHNSRLLVSAGQQVRQGQQIAEMGSTGFSTGPHLHFEIHLPNQGTVNPMAMLPSR
ncbi:MAG: peptidoglycan DD-metalloendopeptidase family protein [Leptolyngbya sp. SIOISBB]|nr:peptidoglycan DD-metalloendopeptidase family protein [Leptolyngbya sp. SIOISBB]